MPLPRRPAAAGRGDLVLGIVHPDDTYLGAPAKDTVVQPGATAVLYGKAAAIAELASRAADPAGERAHREGVAEQESEQESETRFGEPVDG